MEPDSGDILLVLQRSRPLDDEAAIQGRWSVITDIEDGKPAPKEDDVRSVTMAFRGDAFYYDRNHRTRRPGDDHMDGLMVLDPANKPKSITMGAAVINHAHAAGPVRLPALRRDTKGGRPDLAGDL